jgi:non-ribosomal peptide synthase protein (TIGR01720 family)
MIQVVQFDDATQQSSSLLIMVQEIAIDDISWRILLEDFEQLYRQITRHETGTLPLKTTSYKQWAQALTEYGKSTHLQDERDFWLAAHDPQAAIPANGTKVDTTATVLSEQLTTALLSDVPKAYRTQITDVLVTALALAVTDSAENNTISINLETHGREAITAEIDLTRTIGRFATPFPLRLTCEKKANLGDMLKTVKEQLRQIPGGGLGYGLLRETRPNSEAINPLQTLPQPQITLQHRGNFDQLLPATSIFTLVPDRPKTQQTMQSALTLTTSIHRKQLHMEWVYCPSAYQSTAIDQLAQRFIAALKEIITHCQSPTSGGYTPSDFPESGLDQDELNALLAEIGVFEE